MMTAEGSVALELILLKEGRHHDPHYFLGLHKGVIRLWRPGADQIFLEVKGEIVQANQVNALGLFEYTPQTPITPNDYRVFHQSGLLAHDPYS